MTLQQDAEQTLAADTSAKQFYARCIDMIDNGATAKSVDTYTTAHIGAALNLIASELRFIRQALNKRNER